MSGRLTTHVLDLSRGIPAAGVVVQLWKGTEQSGVLLVETHTGPDGRAANPLPADGNLAQGTYELVFLVGDYFRSASPNGGQAVPFLERVPVRFTVADAGENYHIPLLVSPGGYSTYRGS